jgi:hypothetical protein
MSGRFCNSYSWLFGNWMVLESGQGKLHGGNFGALLFCWSIEII